MRKYLLLGSIIAGILVAGGISYASFIGNLGSGVVISSSTPNAYSVQVPLTNTYGGTGTTTALGSNAFNSTTFLTTSTGLTVSNFASPNISQWTNNVGYVTSTSGGSGVASTSPFTVGNLVVVSSSGALASISSSTYITSSTASTFTDNFESESIGSLSGQNSWTSSDTNVAYVSSSQPLANLQSVYTVNDGSGNAISMYRQFSAITTNNVPYSFSYRELKKAGGTGVGADFMLYSSGTEEFAIGFINGDVKVLAWPGPTWHELGSSTANGVDYITGTINGASSSYTISFDGLPSYSSSLNTSDTIDRVRLNNDAGGATQFEGIEYDNIAIGSPVFYPYSNPNGYISTNNPISFTAGGDVSGSTSGTTALSPSLTVTGIQGSSVPSLTTGSLYYSSGWHIGNAVDVSGNQYVTSTSANVTSTYIAYGSATNGITSDNQFVRTSVISTACTGGSITTVATQTVDTFTTSGTFYCPATTTITLLMAGGGGAGGFSLGGGGGAGAVISTTTTLSPGTTTITIGSGGIAPTSSASTSANYGASSTFGGFTESGGAVGSDGSSGANGTPGCSASGGSSASGKTTGGTASCASNNQGNNGGNGSHTSGANLGSGGGGGAGGVGGNAASAAGGNSGLGISSSISGASTTYSCGGAGGADKTDTPASVGGTTCGGVGGAGLLYGQPASSTAANTGSGGSSGGPASGVGANGGSGIVIVSYATPAGATYYVGIGTANPSSTLHVVGTMTVTQTSTFATVSSTNICLSGTCNTTWPSGGSASTTNVTGVAPISVSQSGANATTSLNMGAYLATSGSNLTVSSTLASSSVTFLFGNATTTAPAFQDIETPNAKTITSIDCSEYAAATSTMELFYATSSANNTVAKGNIILSSINCTNTPTSTTSFTTSSLPSGDWLFAIVSSTVGTPTLTTLDVIMTKI